ncbi:YgjP-like metallopeptidase domain-containing protein [Anaeroglobus geminatus]|uniref:YgjP-like metallopeptidase domain-containing protein n=1 Tax=Anaeroglobus geminatus TaxID=156456 RepID=UPI003CCA713D
MTSRWGSCVPFKTMITLNTYLAVMEAEYLEQAVFHEPCHFLKTNHSVRCCGRMIKIMPVWRLYREKLCFYPPAVFKGPVCTAARHCLARRSEYELFCPGCDRRARK